ncbi:MAG: hypothetical protein HY609_00885 [Deltaproteobacteria bacterium]|nr:hypothetical protein [Deltaproteobacteria bacterium]MBI4223463.1 hypothetical protein [Deltaproteobacteria bacterium]
MDADLQLKGLLGGVVQTEQTEAIVHCDPRSLALGTCEGPPPIEETETRRFSVGVGAVTHFSIPSRNSTVQFRPQAGAYLFHPLDAAPALGAGLRHAPSRLELGVQALYGAVSKNPGGLIGLDWQPARKTNLQVGGNFRYLDGPAFYFSAAWVFDFFPKTDS